VSVSSIDLPVFTCKVSFTRLAVSQHCFARLNNSCFYKLEIQDVPIKAEGCILYYITSPNSPVLEMKLENCTKELKAHCLLSTSLTVQIKMFNLGLPFLRLIAHETILYCAAYKPILPLDLSFPCSLNPN